MTFLGPLSIKTTHLAGRATLVIDRGYFKQAILRWWLETGGDVLGTIMRGLKFNPFTFGKEEAKANGSADRPMHISPDSFGTVYQKTVHHNSSSRGPKELALTALAYCSEISSLVAFLVSSRVHKVELDLILSSPRDLPKYLEFANNDLDKDVHAQYMCAFKLTSEQDWMEVAKEETELSDDESIESSNDVRLHPVVMKGVVSLQVAGSYFLGMQLIN